jgi:hypothetical protein
MAGMRRIWMLFVPMALLAGCGGSDAEGAFFDRTKGLKQAGRMALADAVPGEWTSVCFHGGYASVPALKVKNDETDWTLVFYRGEGEVARVQGSYRKLVLNSPVTSTPRDCHGRDAVIVWEGERAMFRGGAR